MLNFLGILLVVIGLIALIHFTLPYWPKPVLDTISKALQDTQKWLDSKNHNDEYIRRIVKEELDKQSNEV